MVRFALWFALVSSVSATTVRPPDFGDLVNQSDYIVRAVVESVESRYEREGSRRIITLVELDVREVVAGAPPSPLVLRLLGGKVGDVEMILEGVPQFREGEEHILFVQGNGRQVYPLVAMMHGVYGVQRDPGQARAYVTRSNRVPLQDRSEVALPMASGSMAEMQRRLSRRSEALSPEEFIMQIRQAVKPGNAPLNALP